MERTWFANRNRYIRGGFGIANVACDIIYLIPKFANNPHRGFGKSSLLFVVPSRVNSQTGIFGVLSCLETCF